MGIRPDPYRYTGSAVLDEDLVCRVLENPHMITLEEDREVLVHVPVLFCQSQQKIIISDVSRFSIRTIKKFPFLPY